MYMYVYTGYLKFQVGIYINEFISLHSHLQRWHKVICIVLCKAVIFIKRIWQQRIKLVFPPQELQSSAGGPEWQLILQWLRLLQHLTGQHLPPLPPPPVGRGHGEGGSGHDPGQGHCCHGNLHTAGLVQLPGDGGGGRIQDSVEQCSSACSMYCFY